MKQALIRRMEPLDYTGAESLNTICSNLTFAGHRIKKVVFTSCTAGEGKSYMTMQIMRNLARRGKRVVLVDADLRRSFLVKRYDIDVEGEGLGLAHYLAGHCPLDEAVYSTNIPGAYIIPSGRTVVNPIPLLNAPAFQSMLSALERQFDIVLIDAPPVGLVVDAAEIARCCDGTVLVVEYNKTRRRELAGAKKQIMQSGCTILGCIINKVSFDTLSAKKYYNRAYYSHYNNEYYRKKSDE